MRNLQPFGRAAGKIVGMTLLTENATQTLVLPTPMGPMRAAADAAGITHLAFCDSADPRAGTEVSPMLDSEIDNPHLRTLSEELAEYFAGQLRLFSVPVNPRGTAFQRQAWDYLQSIPCGQTRSYGQQATAIGSARASRAVGQANGANPIAIIIPCHRVIAGNGGLGGFSAGLERKRWLLRHEGM